MNWNPNEDILQKNFDINAYMGGWWEIAKIPKWFDLQCGTASAEYKKIDDSTISVCNKCYIPDMNGGWECLRLVTGKGQILSNQYPSALFVSFPDEQVRKTAEITNTLISSSKSLQIYPNYLIHSTDYSSYSIVGSPDRQGLYILSRNDKMTKFLYSRILDLVRSLGYDLRKILVNANMLK